MNGEIGEEKRTSGVLVFRFGGADFSRIDISPLRINEFGLGSFETIYHFVSKEIGRINGHWKVEVSSETFAIKECERSCFFG